MDQSTARTLSLIPDMSNKGAFGLLEENGKAQMKKQYHQKQNAQCL